MFNSFKILLSMLLFLTFSPSSADISHGNGYSYIVTDKVRKLDTDEEYINKFTKAFGKKLKKYKNRKKVPKISKIEDSKVAFILLDPGKPRGERPARRKTSISVFNKEIPQAVKDLAIAEFKATEEDFKNYDMGFRFKISERRGGKFSARFYLYRKDAKRDGKLEMLDMTNSIKVAMPKGVYKHKTNLKPEIKGFKYTLWGRGEVASMATEIDKNLMDAGFDTKAKATSDDKTLIEFQTNDVDGAIELVQTTSKDPSVNLLMLVKSKKCKAKLQLSTIGLYTDALGYKCE